MKPVKQPIEINFQGGLNTKTDPKQLPPGKFLELENSVFDTEGLLKKRNGYGAKGTTIQSQLAYSFQAFGANVDSGSFASSFNEELVSGDGYNLFSYSEADNKQTYKGRCASTALEVAPIYQNQYTQILADMAINSTSNYSLYAWESWSRTPDLNGTYQGITYSLLDTETGQTIITGTLASTTNRPKCAAIGSNLYLVYYDTSATELRAVSVSPSAIGSPVTLANNINTTTPNYDLEVNTNLYVAYCGTGTTVKVASFNSSLTPVASTSVAETATNGIGIFHDTSNNVWVAYNNGSATKGFIYNSALSVQVLAPTVVDSGGTAANVKNVTGVYDGTRGIIFYDQQGVPALAMPSSEDVAASFTQPAVGSSVAITTSGSILEFLGTIVYVPTGGYYYVSSYGPLTTQASLINLGYTGNAAPGATVASTAQVITPAYGNINALITYNTLTSAGVVGTAANFIRSAALNSKAFLKDGIANVVISYDSPIQPVYFLASLYNISASASVRIANLSAKVFDGEAGGIPYRSILPSVNLFSGKYNVALPKRIYSVQKTSAEVPVTLWYNGIYVVRFDMSPTQVITEELGECLQIAMGSSLMYDGNTVVEQGFHVDPENITGVDAPGSGFITDGTYGYVVVYQWIDANGLIYRSAPSPVLSMVLSGSTTHQITLTIPALRLTAKGDATITVYRTEANGSIFYRIDTQRIAPGFYPVNNSLTADTISYVDGINDSQIVGNEQLYTTGGEVENIGPPGATVISNFKSRAMLVPYDNPNAIGYSKQIIPGTAVEFSDLFYQNVDSVGGPIITCAPMDDKFIIYKPESIYYMLGSGPAPSGANNDFTEPLLITTDAGCVDKASVVQMPLGHMFKSKKGIYLLNRGLQAEYIGADVDAYNQYNVLSALLIADQNQVRYTLSSGDVLMYDYYYKQWSVFPNLDSVSDCIYQDLHTYIKADGTIYQETPGVYLDGADPVLMYFKTSWIKLSGLQGYQRAYFLYILGEYLSAHNLSLEIAYDYAYTGSQTTLIAPPNTAANTLERWRIFLARQRCQAVQLALQEVYTGTPGAGFTMSGVQFVVGLKSGFRPTPNAYTAG